jgi:hypothetical protein
MAAVTANDGPVSAAALMSSERKFSLPKNCREPR